MSEEKAMASPRAFTEEGQQRCTAPDAKIEREENAPLLTKSVNFNLISAWVSATVSQSCALATS